jgi:hypothetical protein
VVHHSGCEDFGLNSSVTRGRGRLGCSARSLRKPTSLTRSGPPRSTHASPAIAAIYGTDELRAEVNTVEADLARAFHTALSGRVLPEPTASTASIPKQLRILEYALAELGKAERLTPGLSCR